MLCDLKVMEIFEVFMLIYLPCGTFLLNKWRGAMDSKNTLSKVAYGLVSLIMAGAPFIYIQSFAANYTALAVVLVGIGFFWFAIVGARSAIT
tara:strand:+ start:10856 stop:11131 length:276 start_codon:yes stop_codon:yes gene_type:complete